ncbi:MAG TPA: MauE/DoxX family redox-associated membrane protein [Acidobacteriota bacterium]|nr:MauE/DoxX family redox-associated membrane protein [Acidobacteriota bacterium]
MTLRILHWASRCFLAAVFLYSGYIKIESPLQFAAIIEGYQLEPVLPAALVWPIARYFPWFEIALALFLLIGWKIRYVAWVTTAVLLTFIVILTITLARGIEANCGCFSFDDPITIRTIIRDGLILIPALFLSFQHRFRRKPGTAETPKTV